MTKHDPPYKWNSKTALVELKRELERDPGNDLVREEVEKMKAGWYDDDPHPMSDVCPNDHLSPAQLERLEDEVREWEQRHKGNGTFVVHRWKDYDANTYHKVYAYFSDGRFYESDMEYGYENAWEVTARLIADLPSIPEGVGTLDQLGWHSHVIDVRTRKEL